jgi:arginyl-tRNA synthetase
MKFVIEQAIALSLEQLGLPQAKFVVEHPADFIHGDYSSNVALVLSKQVGKVPRQIAEEIVAIMTEQIEYVEKITIAGPGFINFHLSRDFFATEVFRINHVPERWGSNESLCGEEIIFEYTSPNLFKPLHVGNLVGNIIGESMTRLLEASGAVVHRVNYPSDIGLTVAKGVWGLQKTGGDPEDISKLGEAYRIGNDAYENDPQAKLEIETVNRALYAGSDIELMSLRERGLATSKKRLAELCAVLGTKFDTEIYESDVSELGKELALSNVGEIFAESEGAIVYYGEKHGLHTRVFVNSQGLPTYEAKDLGNFSKKIDTYPAWTQSFVVTGNEQSEYFKVLIAAVKEVFPAAKDKLIEHIATGFLTLTTGKMSSRKGNVLTGESLLAEMEEEARKKAEASRSENVDELTEMVAVAALKYQILRQAPGTNIIFNKEQAISFEGDSGPYLQYTYARIVSVLEKAKVAGVVTEGKVLPENTYLLEKFLYQFEEVVLEAQTDRAPQKLTVYLTELAGAFNAFYAQEKIADSTDEYSPYKAALTEAVGTTLKNGLYLLGIKAPNAM